MKKTISILGSTGSIGLTTLKIIDKKRSFFSINVLLANKNYKLIINQIQKYKPKYFIISDKFIYEKVKKKNKFKECKILNKYELLNFKKSDITVSAIPGIDGLKPTIFFINISKKILIANKEAIVCGWEIIKNKAKKSKTSIVPIDSEHFSLSKLINKYQFSKIKNFYITASGGPFLNYNLKDFKHITPAKALKHPKWKMGKKISIDSSTLMNKILEVAEAQKLFDIPKDKINIVIHPNSLVHAIVELENGLVDFIYHANSMIIPIANAIFGNNLKINDFLKLKKPIFENELIFKKVDKKKFPLISLKNKIMDYPSSPIIINASNEIAVNQFLSNKIPFVSIAKIIIRVLKDRNFKKNAIKRPQNINQITKIDYWAKKVTLSIINKLYV